MFISFQVVETVGAHSSPVSGWRCPLLRISLFLTLRGQSNMRDHSLGEVHESPIAIPNVPSMGERVRVAQTVLP